MSDLKELSDSELVAQIAFLGVCGDAIEQSVYGCDPEIPKVVWDCLSRRIAAITIELKQRRGLFF